jgi:hypothetical protein
MNYLLYMYAQMHPKPPSLFYPAARTKLRKLLADKDKAAATGSSSNNAAGKSAADVSPHARASYDPAEFEALVKQYEGLKWRMISKPGGATVKPDDFYR